MLQMDGLCDVRVYFVPAFHQTLARVTLYPLNPGPDSETFSVSLLLCFISLSHEVHTQALETKTNHRRELDAWHTELTDQMHGCSH